MINLRELLLPGILLSEILVSLFLGSYIPADLKSFFLSISLTLKSILLAVLPFIIFSFVIGSMSELKRGALSFVLLAFAMVMTSNFVATGLAGIVGFSTLPGIHLAQNILPTTELLPLWNLEIPQVISNELALFSGIISGILISLFGAEKVRKFPRTLPRYANLFLKKCFIPFLPLFVLGFILKIEHEGILESLFANYLSLVLMIASIAAGYIIFLYGVATHFNINHWLSSLKNMIPAMITGFSTMSSASALPLIITAAEKNTGEKIVRGVAPISINIHLLGDCFSLCILSMAILLSFGYPLPSAGEYLIFICFFVLAKFAVAGVPGGTVLVMLPVFERYLGFNSEMLSLITLLYILFDPIITPINILGNGGFAMLYVKLYQRLGFSKNTEKVFVN